MQSCPLATFLSASLGGLPRKHREFVGLERKANGLNLLEAAGGFDRLRGVRAGNITAPEPPTGLEQTGLYSHPDDSWAATHLRASGSSGEKVTKPK